MERKEAKAKKISALFRTNITDNWKYPFPVIPS